MSFKPKIVGDTEGVYTAAGAVCKDIKGFINTVVSPAIFETIEIVEYKRLRYFIVTKGYLGNESPNVFVKLQPSEKMAQRSMQIEMRSLGPNFSQVDLVALYPNCSVAASGFVKTSSEDKQKAKALFVQDGSTKGDIDPAIADTLNNLHAVLNRSLVNDVDSKCRSTMSSNCSTALGMISLSSIESAKEILTEAGSILGDVKGSENLAKLDRLSQSYNRLVPSSQPIFLSSIGVLEHQAAFLDNLSFACSEAILGSGFSPSNFLAGHGLKMSVVPKGSAKYVGIESKILHESKSTHRADFKIKNIFELGTDKGNKWPTFNVGDLPNVVELFHGTGNSNLLSILASSLKMPLNLGPSISKTGHMFGAGCYFGEYSKSMQYCYNKFNSNSKGHRFYILICEVALGRPCLVTKPMHALRAPNGFNSVMAIGREGLHKGVHINGVEPEFSFHLSAGDVRKHVHDSPLLYNEFIVYNTNQIKPKYLIEFWG